MKKIVFLAIIFVLLISISSAYSEGVFTSKVNINNLPVPYMEYDDKLYIKVNDLQNYGFDVVWSEYGDEVNVSENQFLPLIPIKQNNYKISTDMITESSIKVYLDNNLVSALTMGKDIFINIQKLDRLDTVKDIFKNYESDDICVETKCKHLFEIQKSKEIQINRKDDKLFFNKKEIGFIKNNIEYICLKNFGDEFQGYQFTFDDSNSYYKETVDFDKYRVEIIWSDKEPYDATVFWDDKFLYEKILLANPMKIGETVYLTVVDFEELLNTNIIIKDMEYDKEPLIQGAGNVFNQQGLIKVDDWIYYVNNEIGGYLFRTNISSNVDEEVIHDDVYNLQLSDNHIYYIVKRKDRNGIYRMNKDSSNQVRLVEGNYSYLKVLDDFIYYCEVEEDLDKHEDVEKGGRLYRIDKKLKDKKLVIDSFIRYPNILDNHIYYINTEDNNSIYYKNLNSGLIRKLSNRNVQFLNTDGKNLYFGNRKDIYRIDMDGTHELMIKSEYYNQPMGVILGENSIVWDNYDVLVKISKDGKNKAEYYEENLSRSLGIEKDTLYEVSEKEYHGFYRILNGKIEKLPFVDGEEIIAIKDSKIYYQGNYDKLYRVDIDDNNEEIIIEDFFSFNKVIGNFIFYRPSGKGKLYCLNLNNNKSKRLFDSSVKDFKIEVDGVYALEKLEDGVSISKISLDGTQKNIILKISVEDDNPDQAQLAREICFVVDKEYIYYYYNGNIYRIKKDGTNNIIIQKNVLDLAYEKYEREIEVSENYIYYIQKNELYRVNKDGSNRELIIEAYCDSIFFTDSDDVYCLNDMEVFRHNSTTNKKEVLIDKYDSEDLWKIGDNLYFIDESDYNYRNNKCDLSRVNIVTKSIEKCDTNVDKNSIKVVDGQIYYTKSFKDKGLSIK